jgi:IS30 family transposase
LERVDKIVSPLLKKGQSVRSICLRKADEIMISDKTVYNYLGKSLLNADFFDLKRKVQRKTRKKAGPPMLVDNKCRAGRTHDDYKSYMNDHPDTSVVQMDTVEGNKGGKVILTLLFQNCNLQIGYLRDSNDSASVSRVFTELRTVLTSDEYCKLFPVILTDRGSEFSDPRRIEVDYDTGEVQSSVFFCDPQNTNQKSPCERNHEFIRYVIPKGKSLDGLTQEIVNKMMNHINSYGREKYNYKSPLDLFESIYGSEITKKLGIKRISPDDVCLTPELLKK